MSDISLHQKKKKKAVDKAGQDNSDWWNMTCHGAFGFSYSASHLCHQSLFYDRIAPSIVLYLFHERQWVEVTSWPISSHHPHRLEEKEFGFNVSLVMLL